jgi:hypothetical protein
MYQISVLKINKFYPHPALVLKFSLLSEEILDWRERLIMKTEAKLKAIYTANIVARSENSFHN